MVAEAASAPLSPSRVLTEAEWERVEQLVNDGLPATWIAEDLGLTSRGLRQRMRRHGFMRDEVKQNGKDFIDVWTTIRVTPAIYDIHSQVRPKDVAS